MKEASSTQGVHLKRNIGFFQCCSISMGVMIGSTIFVTPASITLHVGSVALSLLVWVVAALVMLLQAVCFTELAIRYPKAGGMYVYLRMIGDFPAFLYAWYFCMICQPAFMAFTAIMISSYIIMPIFGECTLPQSAIKIINIWIIVTLVFLNSFYLEFVKKAQNVLTIAKFCALMGIVGIGLIELIKGRNGVLKTGFQNSIFDVGSLAIAIYTCMTNYAGWEYLLMMTEEVKNPSKTIPKAIYVSFFAVGTIFVLTNVAYFTVLSPADIIASETVAATFSERTLGSISIAIPMVVALSAVGSLNAVVMGGSRVCFAAARDDLFPKFLAMISIKHKTPFPAVMLTCLLSSLWSLWGDPISVIEYLGFNDLLFIALTTVSLIYLKLRRPDMKSSYKVPLCLPILSLVILLSLISFGIYNQPFKTLIGLIPLVFGIPFYLLGRFRKNRDVPYSHIQYKVIRCLQSLMLVTKEEDHTDQ